MWTFYVAFEIKFKNTFWNLKPEAYSTPPPWTMSVVLMGGGLIRPKWVLSPPLQEFVLALDKFLKTPLLGSGVYKVKKIYCNVYIVITMKVFRRNVRIVKISHSFHVYSSPCISSHVYSSPCISSYVYSSPCITIFVNKTIN